MEFDSSTLVYIIAVVVYFLYSTFFNKKVPEQTNDEPTTQTEAKPRKTVSFDDLLKEIRREQGQMERELDGRPVEDEEYDEEESYVEEERYNAPKKSNPQPTPKKYFTYEDPEQFPSSDAAYQKSQKRYQNYEKQPLVKLDDQINLESNEKILGEVEDVAGNVKRKNKYAGILKNPVTVREAIVVSEILRRKHF